MTRQRTFAYKLIGRLVVPITLSEFSNIYGRDPGANRVAQTQVGPLWVSTVFVGIDMEWPDDQPPLVFETMIFDDGDDTYQTRCSTWEQAEAMHRRAVQAAEQVTARSAEVLAELEPIVAAVRELLEKQA